MRQITKIVDIKQSQWLYAPCNCKPFAKSSRDSEFSGQKPLFTSYDAAFELKVMNNSLQKEKVTVVGNLCTALDVIKEDVELNKAAIGDIISAVWFIF